MILTDFHFSTDYLDVVRSIPSVQVLKQRSFQLLKLPLGGAVLDVGCGTGEDVHALAGIVGPSGKAVGIDHSSGTIGEARRRKATSTVPVHFEVGDAYHLPFPDATFHGVRAERLLHFLDRPVDSLAEMVRVTRPAGWIVVCEPDWQTLTVDGPDPMITQELISFAFRSRTHSTNERFVSQALRRVGLQSVTGTTETLTLVDSRLAMQIFRLREMVFSALISGAITSQQSAIWLLGLERAAQESRFGASLTGCIVHGCKPLEN